MVVKTLPVGQLETNCYIIADETTKSALIIDPGDEPDRIEELTKDLDIVCIVITHAHFDHVGAIADLKKSTGATIALHEAEQELYDTVKDQAAFWGYDMDDLPEPDLLLGEGDEIKAGILSFTVMHTPGHSPGGICLYGEGIVITGDTLFAGSVGRTDFPGGDINQLKMSFRRLMELPDNTLVLSGHGGSTTIANERENNMFAPQFLSG